MKLPTFSLPSSIWEKSSGTINTYKEVEDDEDVLKQPSLKLIYYCMLILSISVVSFGAAMLFLPGVLHTTPALSPGLYKSHVRAVVYSWLSQRYANADVSKVDIPYQTNYEAPVEKVISCYYNTPSHLEALELQPSDINPHLCTHINIAFARIVDNGIFIDDNQKKAIMQVVKLKSINPKLKILLSVGGAGNKNGFSEMVADHANRKTFIKSIKWCLRNYTLDGIDLDWEFPAVHSRKVDRTKNRERQHFSQLLREIRAEYKRENREYLLTVAAGAPESIVDTSYDVDQLNLYTDFVNIMTYDFHFYTQYTPFTGLNSPLYPRQTEKLYLSTLNINYTVHMYQRKGLDCNKIVVGIPTYGHSFHLVNADNPNIGSPASGYGSLGSLGFVNYPDICNFLKLKSNVTVKEENCTKVPYLYSFHEWVSYDTPQSVMEKANYIKDNNLRGAMIYSLNADDYLGVCELGDVKKFPLSHSVKNSLLGTDHNE